MTGRIITSVEELKALDATIKEKCHGLPIEPGSLSRLHSDFYPAYNIYIPYEQQAELEAYSLECFESEWSATDAETNRAIERAIKNANIASGNSDMNGKLANLLLSILKAMYKDKNKITIVDIGAGDGNTTQALLDALDEDKEDGPEIAKRCYFKMIEPSWWRLEDAREILGGNNIVNTVYHGAKARFALRCQTLGSYLDEAKDGDADIIISSAALHHMSFPTYLEGVYRHLSADGILAVGDWHNNLLRHPANLADIIKELGADNETLDWFSSRFNLKTDMSSRIEKELPAPDRSANRDFKHFVIALGNEMKKVGRTSRIAFIEALNTLDVRTKEMNDAGIVTDINELRLKHAGFAKVDRNIRRLMFDRNVAFVVAGAKIPQNKAA